jgi:hypothetical protein
MGPGRVELPTLRLSGARSNQLSYEPKTKHLLSGFAIAVVRTQLNLILILSKEPVPFSGTNKNAADNTASDISKTRHSNFLLISSQGQKLTIFKIFRNSSPKFFSTTIHNEISNPVAILRVYIRSKT